MSAAVSVVVTSYNYGRYLAGALDSLARQTFPNFEAWIIDDGSTDDTPQVAARYLADPRFRYHRTPHIGQPAAKNTGIRLSTAPWVAFLDADDLWQPQKLAKQMALVDADPELGLIYSGMQLIDEQGTILEFEQPGMRRGWVLPEIFRDNFVCFSSSMVRRAAFSRVGAFNESIPLAIDYELWLRVASDYRLDYVDEPLVLYRTGHANLSRRTAERLEIVLSIMDRFVAEHPAAQKLLPGEIRRAYVETLNHLALAERERSLWAAARSHLRALRMAPADFGTWRGLAVLALPEPGRSALRSALGKPDWRVRHPKAAAPIVRKGAAL